MVIRVLLERLERERECLAAAVKRLDQLKNEVLQSCRGEAKKAREGRKGGQPCPDQGEARKAA